MYLKIFTSLFLSLVLALFSTTTVVSGQLITSESIQQSITITISPENPGSYQDVSVRLESSDINLSAAKITWTVNGKTAKSGIGEKTLSLRTRALGDTENIAIFVDPFNEPTALSRVPFQKQVIIRPADVDLLFRAKTYTPSFYKGKALYSPQSELFIVAIPHLVSSSKNLISSSNLVYTWTQDGSVIADASGYGRDTFHYLGPVVSFIKTIGVRASSVDGNIVAQNQITLIPTDPRISLYEDHPLYGILSNRELGSVFPLKEKEVSLVAVPYFFSANNKFDPSLDFAWKINGLPITVQDKKERIVFRQTEEGLRGSSNISVSIKNTGKLLQFGSKNLSITFGQ